MQCGASTSVGRRLNGDAEEILFSEPRPAFHQRGRDPIFHPVGSYPPMTVPELAAKDWATA